ncbi:MAG: hypothetical protein WC849_02885 [Candidatus Paceibacterota bacterium]
MPNIEIHGLDNHNANLVKERIDNVMIKLGLKDEAITTTYDVKTESCDGKKTLKPYLRICCTTENGRFIAERISEENVNMDIEILRLESFIPAKK